MKQALVGIVFGVAHISGNGDTTLIIHINGNPQNEVRMFRKQVKHLFFDADTQVETVAIPA